VPDTRYDEIATAYARHWGPVIAPAAEQLLELPLGIDAGPSRVLDIGAGTGVLSLGVLRRWPNAEVAAVDPSAGMLEIARREADPVARRGAGPVADRAPSRLETHVAYADELPFEDASFDVALSSFALQLVPSRAAALREARRVLRPGGRIAWAAWLVGGERFAPDEVVNDVLDDFGFDPPDPEARSGDIASASAAAATTRRAGFGDVSATTRALEHRWTAEAYLAFIAEFDEQSLFDELDRKERGEIEARMLAGLRKLSSADLTMRLPVVYVTGRAGGRGDR
jgi:SAM-dependent methyltransferase